MNGGLAASGPRAALTEAGMELAGGEALSLGPQLLRWESPA